MSQNQYQSNYLLRKQPENHHEISDTEAFYPSNKYDLI